jgi:hypothetical protein
MKDKVNGPAIALMITAGIGAIGSIIWLLLHLLGLGLMAAGTAAEGGSAGGMAGMMQGTFGLVMQLVGIALTAAIIFGAWKMKTLGDWNLAIVGAILAIIPCTSPCCCLTIGPGIWALVVLLNGEVRAAFPNQPAYTPPQPPASPPPPPGK